jgi:hypothetical protein
MTSMRRNEYRPADPSVVRKPQLRDGMIRFLTHSVCRKGRMQRGDALTPGALQGAAGSARRAMIVLFRERKRALVELAARQPGYIGDFADGIF